MFKVSGKQCLKARALLKWNLLDLVNRANNLQPRRIDSFEKGVVQLYKWENDAICSVFQDAGIMFASDFEVTLKGTESEKDGNRLQGMQGEGARIVLDVDQTVVSDTSDGKVATVAVPLTEEEKARERARQLEREEKKK